MRFYRVKTSPEEDQNIDELKKLFGEKTTSKVFRKLLTVKFVIEKINGK